MGADLNFSDQILQGGKIEAHTSLAGLQGQRYGRTGLTLM